MYLRCLLRINCSLFFFFFEVTLVLTWKSSYLSLPRAEAASIRPHSQLHLSHPAVSSPLSSSYFLFRFFLPSSHFIHSQSWSFRPLWDPASLTIASSSFPDFSAIYSMRHIVLWATDMHIALFSSTKHGYSLNKHQHLWKNQSKQAYTHLQAPQHEPC